MKVQLIEAERTLSPTQISIADYTINPYRGCPFGCLYCYTQENKAIKKRNQAWGTFIDIKTNAVELLFKEIQGKNIQRVLLGSTVECYPPQENEFLLTRHIIELLNKNKIPVTILTKSPLIERDLDIISKNKNNKIYLTINYEKAEIKSLLEPLSPSIEDRLTVLDKIEDFQINRRIHVAPLIPYIQDYELICEMTSPHTDEFSIEIYNPKMGNWNVIRNILKENFSKDILEKTSNILSYEDDYTEYITRLASSIESLSKRLHTKILLLAPAFKDYYKSNISYD